MPDRIRIAADADTGAINLQAGSAELNALVGIMDAGSPVNRINALRRHVALTKTVDDLTNRCALKNGRADISLLHAILQAEQIALYLDSEKKVARDNRRQAGTHKERRPAVTKWIAKQLDRNPSAKCPALWSTAPEWLTEQIGLDSFKKRVTAERKKRRK